MYAQRTYATHLVWPDYDIIAVIHARVNVQRAHSPKYDLCGRMPVEGSARQVDREVRIARILVHTVNLVSKQVIDN